MQNSEDIQQHWSQKQRLTRCGLMQNSEDIQRPFFGYPLNRRCGLMQNSEDIQRNIDYAIIRYPLYQPRLAR